jgi:hypothetical protein
MRITDDNTLEDIQGVILCLQADVGEQKPEFPVAPRFQELLTRINDKLTRNKNAVRKKWFETAREHALAAERAFLERRARDADASLQRCWDYLEQGNKAHRRKATFVAGTDGQVVSASALDDGEPDAAPNGGPATRLGNSGVTEGPPSVS